MTMITTRVVDDEDTKIAVLGRVDKVCEATTDAQIAAGVENQRRPEGTSCAHMPYRQRHKTWPL